MSRLNGNNKRRPHTRPAIGFILHTHTRLTAFCPGLPGWADTRKVKPIRILLKQETVSGSGISWAICKSAPHFRQITMPTPHHSVFTGRMPFLPPIQQCQSTEGTILLYIYICTIRLLYYQGTHTHTPVYRPFFRDYPGEPVPER